MLLDLEFPLNSSAPIAVDHGYHLYAGLCRVLDQLHSENSIAIHPVRGRQIGNRLVQLMPWSTLRLRLPQDAIGDMISLSGKSIQIDDSKVNLGVPSVKALVPAAALRSRLVTIKGFQQPDPFAEAVRRQLNALGLNERCVLTVAKRRTLRIKDKEVVGFEVILEELLPNESMAVQEVGIGGRRHMGCGVFVPWSPQPNAGSLAREAKDG